MKDRSATEFSVEPADVGRRLDQVLAERLSVSRAVAQRRIAAGDVRINGQRAEKDDRLEPGVTIVVANQPPPPKAALTKEPTIVAEDDAVLVLDKPAGLVMHSGPGIHEQTLADWLVERRPGLGGVGEDPLRPGIVHRLDREASGLVVVAKTQAAYDFLKRAFQEHRVEKHYLALVHGNVADDVGTVIFPIKRSVRDGKMAAKPIGGEGREAETRFSVLERLPPFTLLDVTTKTGRTHQVRVHLRAFGHPVAGDQLYRTKQPTKRDSPRLFLHAGKLSFPHPVGETRTYVSPLPQDLAGFLSAIKPP